MTIAHFHPQPVTLQTNDICLRPLRLDDAQGFYRAGNYPELWRWVKPNQCSSLAQTQTWLTASLEKQAQGLHLPFVILDNQSQTLIGSTRFCAINLMDKTVEIGFTFITPKFQRSHVNTQAKYLLLKHAFEQWRVNRVQLRTHEQNTASRKAIARIGGQFEGIIRHHRILADGSVRNTAVFSVIDPEWPIVKRKLEAMMSAATEEVS